MVMDSAKKDQAPRNVHRHPSDHLFQDGISVRGRRPDLTRCGDARPEAASLPAAGAHFDIGDGSGGRPILFYQHTGHEERDPDWYSVFVKLLVIQYEKVGAEPLIQEKRSTQQRKRDDNEFEHAHGHLPSCVY
jgi:hypothetical protein